ncbi:hypothetical protein [Caulobacter hibisci]|uniref:Uncharacterized protein n=1 Tax=Caulobacter hibisci TaxID=2035993 RepID=A0ABS0T2K7_9CAUL|nr:hypothetical protein [Caulobacter hibisci]MBI1685889.1 hypothetical protein [Caulobacter hibisci]
MRILIGASAVALLLTAQAMAAQAQAGELAGPGRFCGYSPIIDLLPGEKVTTLQGGAHAGTFRWEGPFGVLEVSGSGWGARPPGAIVRRLSKTEPARFAQRRDHGRHVVALWNGGYGAAHFSSDKRLTKAQIAAIDRVRLFQEGETPSGCDLRTVFSWDLPQ